MLEPKPSALPLGYTPSWSFFKMHHIPPFLKSNPLFLLLSVHTHQRTWEICFPAFQCWKKPSFDLIALKQAFLVLKETPFFLVSFTQKSLLLLFFRLKPQPLILNLSFLKFPFKKSTRHSRNGGCSIKIPKMTITKTERLSTPVVWKRKGPFLFFHQSPNFIPAHHFFEEHPFFLFFWKWACIPPRSHDFFHHKAPAFSKRGKFQRKLSPVRIELTFGLWKSPVLTTRRWRRIKGKKFMKDSNAESLIWTNGPKIFSLLLCHWAISARTHEEIQPFY